MFMMSSKGVKGRSKGLNGRQREFEGNSKFKGSQRDFKGSSKGAKGAQKGKGPLTLRAQALKGFSGRWALLGGRIAMCDGRRAEAADPHRATWNP